MAASAQPAANNPLFQNGDILKIFDSINSEQGGMIRSGAFGSLPGGNRAFGSNRQGSATIQIGITTPGPPTARGDAPIALHETIHHTGMNIYGDETLATAVSRRPGSPKLGEPPSGSTADDKAYFYSNYWNTELRNHCK